jgi:hypothetical protein
MDVEFWPMALKSDSAFLSEIHLKTSAADNANDIEDSLNEVSKFSCFLS